MFSLRQWYADNDMMDKYEELKEWAIDKDQLWPIIEPTFHACDDNRNNIIDENEWTKYA